MACWMLVYDCASRLGPSRVEITTEQRRQIPRLRAAENQLLRLNRSRRVHKQLITGPMPALQRFNRIRVNMPFQLPGMITLSPDHALQGLERRGFAIFLNPAQEDFNNPFNIGLRCIAVTAHGVELLGDTARAAF